MISPEFEEDDIEENDSEDEGIDDYKIGGYHPVHIGYRLRVDLANSLEKFFKGDTWSFKNLAGVISQLFGCARTLNMILT
jgi:hypothetical protein